MNHFWLVVVSVTIATRPFLQTFIATGPLLHKHLRSCLSPLQQDPCCKPSLQKYPGCKSISGRVRHRCNKTLVGNLCYNITLVAKASPDHGCVCRHCSGVAWIATVMDGGHLRLAAPLRHLAWSRGTSSHVFLEEEQHKWLLGHGEEAHTRLCVGFVSTLMMLYWTKRLSSILYRTCMHLSINLLIICVLRSML